MKNLKYVINSIKEYQKASDILEQSLIENGVNRDDIIYVYGKNDEDKIEKNKFNQICIYLKTNFYEYNSILGLYKLFLHDTNYQNYNFLLLHDTCKALKGFKEKSINLNNVLNKLKKDIYWAQKKGRHNIGIFSSRSIIFLTKKCIIPLMSIDFDKMYALKMEWDLVPESLHIHPELDCIYTSEHTLLPPYKSKLYSRTYRRNIAYLMCLNLVKYYVYLGPINKNSASRHPNKIE